eukprot:6252226-Prymnesium_polylepis.1
MYHHPSVRLLSGRLSGCCQVLSYCQVLSGTVRRCPKTFKPGLKPFIALDIAATHVATNTKERMQIGKCIGNRNAESPVRRPGRAFPSLSTQTLAHVSLSGAGAPNCERRASPTRILAHLQ